MFDGFQIGLRIGQLLLILLKAQAGSLLLELEFGDALAQRVELALELHASLVAGAQLGGQVVIFAAAGAQCLLALQLQCQGVLQAGLRGGIGQAGQLVLRALFFVVDGARLLLGRLNRAGQLGIACLQAALGKRGFLGLAFQAALLFTALGQLALRLDHALVQLGMALLAVGQLHVQ